MVSQPGRGRDGDDDALSGEPPAFSDPAFSEEGMRRIIYGRDRADARDGRSQAFTEDTRELETDLRKRRNLVPIVTALAAVFCFGAIVWYAYTWGTGQLSSDELPVVSAQPMPEKTRPEQPGGLEVPHQGIAVLNDGGAAEASPVVERLLPRPETPAPPEPLVLPEAPVAEAPLAEEAPEMPLMSDGSEADVTGAPEMVPGTAEEPEPAEVAEGGIAKPLPRPSGAADEIAALLAQGPVETADGKAADGAAPAPKAAPKPTQTAAATAGDVVLQLSSVKSEAAAAQEWKRLQGEHPGLLGKLPLALETAAVQGTTYYRVQTGPFASRDAAAQVCTQLKARNQDCLVKQR